MRNLLNALERAARTGRDRPASRLPAGTDQRPCFPGSAARSGCFPDPVSSDGCLPPPGGPVRPLGVDHGQTVFRG
jgi:hypothetical protein